LLCQAAVLAALVLPTAAANAALTNGDFSAGFDGWSGRVVTCTLCDGTDDAPTDLSPPPGGFSGNFQTGPDGATIATSYNDNAVYWTQLWQVFTVDPLMGRATSLALDLTIDVVLSDDVNDLAIAVLQDPAGTLTPVDLLAGGPVDITAFAGRQAELYFEVSDFLDGLRDTLTVGDIRVEQVPLPATLLLLVPGLWLFAAGRCRSARPYRKL
jgi:hypothetical protein